MCCLHICLHTFLHNGLHIVLHTGFMTAGVLSTLLSEASLLHSYTPEALSYTPEALSYTPKSSLLNSCNFPTYHLSPAKIRLICDIRTRLRMKNANLTEEQKDRRASQPLSCPFPFIIYCLSYIAWLSKSSPLGGGLEGGQGAKGGYSTTDCSRRHCRRHRCR